MPQTPTEDGYAAHLELPERVEARAALTDAGLLYPPPASDDRVLL